MLISWRLFVALIAGQAVAVVIGLWLFVMQSSASIAQALSAKDAAPATKGVLLSHLTPMAIVAAGWIVGVSSIIAFLQLSRLRAMQKQRDSESANSSLKQTQQLIRTRDSIIFALAKLADSRDPDTGDHLERIAIYSRLLATAAGKSPKFAREISPQYVKMLTLASALHDIGKVGVEDRVLLKPGPLTDEERRSMQRHTLIAGDCLRDIARRMGDSPLLQMARDIALGHHERWDGTGYPRGIRGAQNPLSARIVAIADVYDALTSKRVYKAAMSHAECAAKLREGAGSHFDPDLIQIWCEIEDEFATTAARYAAGATQSAKPAPIVPKAVDASAPLALPAPVDSSSLDSPARPQFQETRG